MKVRKIIAILAIAALVSCEDDDGPDTSRIIVGGPTDSVDPGGETGGGETTDDPLLYNATEYLKDIVNFPMGNIVSAAKLSNSSQDEFREVLGNEYNSITAENDMKMASMYVGPDDYNWSDGDEIVDYAKANGLRVHGHALVWHSSIPGWLNSFDGTDEEFETLIENYIKETVAHFAEVKDDNGNSIVASWDVVNEIWDGPVLRGTLFREKMGDDYASKLFTWAREADADVKLFYNDYNIAGEPGKRNSIINMVSDFQANNVPIDGIGMQMHLNHNWPTDDLPLSIEQIAGTGLLVHISELDVKANYGDDVTELTQERAEEQEDQYQRAGYYYTELVPEAQQHGITIWGFRDSESWLYDGGNDWPLLYDNEFNTKIAHRGLVAGLNGEAVE
ncbi:endo-1,4-beta-xylanase [Urechidicola croceus]|uniref:Beta-xylanase n=1 Tax=Urechidicola croceus TaxID=1850246 RepID=A0A1D8P7L0_9FLAO|nr:endo-1,4-beta-xylanase [Urechidicola croceus]AOW20566.1 hypothetical protein LPB138_07685 [Urechidicola croceus]